jgi:hypothetical protein
MELVPQIRESCATDLDRQISIDVHETIEGSSENPKRRVHRVITPFMQTQVSSI